MEEPTEVECPVCSRKFKRTSINFHLDSCLEELQNSPKRARNETNSQSKKPKIDTAKQNAVSEQSPAKSSFNFNGKIGNSPKEICSVNTSMKNQFAPLAEKMRPNKLEEYSGQEQILGKECILRKLIERNDIPSMVFWGPPGCGKTTLAHIIAKRNQELGKCRFVTLSAATSGVKDVKDVIETAKSTQKMFKKKTILFIDEIHRFNKLQQDVFLPHVENGTIILIGATTENPSFSLNSALLSRCRVVILEKLQAHYVEEILKRAVHKMDFKIINSKDSLDENIQQGQFIEKSAVKSLAELCDGDARFALNCFEIAVQSLNSNHEEDFDNEIQVITTEHITKGLKKLHLLYDRTGDQHYNCISAFIKSMRGSAVNATLYWLARMIEGGEDPRYVARRMIIFASEDIGVADSNALNLAASTLFSCQNVGMPECKINLAHCATYLAKAPKSRSAYEAYEKAVECVKNQKGPQPSVPLHLCNAPTRLMKEMGCGKGYKMYNDPSTYMPESLQHLNFFA